MASCDKTGNYWHTTKLIYEDGHEILVTLDQPTLRKLEDGDSDLMQKIRRNYDSGQSQGKTGNQCSMDSTDTVSAPTSSHTVSISKESNISFSHEETLFLIDQFCENKNDFESPLVKKKLLWEKIKNKFNERFNRQFRKEQVEGRWKTLVAAYKKHKIHQNTTGTDRKEFVYESQFDIIFEGRHDIEPAGTLSSMVSKKRKLVSKEEESEEEKQVSADDQEKITNEEEKNEGEDNLQCQPMGKGKRLKAKSKASGGMTCVMKFLQDYSKKQDEREEQRLQREESMHKERMALMSGFLDIMKDQMNGKQTNH